MQKLSIVIRDNYMIQVLDKDITKDFNIEEREKNRQIVLLRKIKF